MFLTIEWGFLSLIWGDGVEKASEGSRISNSQTRLSRRKGESFCGEHAELFTQSFFCKRDDDSVGNYYFLERDTACGLLIVGSQISSFYAEH